MKYLEFNTALLQMCPVSPENFHPNTNSVTSLHKLMSPPLGIAQSEATSTPRLPEHLHRTSGGFWGHIKIQCKELKSYIWCAWSAIMAHYTLNFKWHPHLIYVTHLCFQLGEGPGAQEKLVASSSLQSECLAELPGVTHCLCKAWDPKHPPVPVLPMPNTDPPAWCLSNPQSQTGVVKFSICDRTPVLVLIPEKNTISTTLNLKYSINLVYHCVLWYLGLKINSFL